MKLQKEMLGRMIMSVTYENVSLLIFCIPASSTPAERILCCRKHLLTKKSKLSREHFDMLTFLHFNSALIDNPKKDTAFC